jgi:hypothetical protein
MAGLNDLDPALFPRFVGRRILGFEYDKLAEREDREWLGIQFDGGEYLSIWAEETITGGVVDPALRFSFRRRCPKDYRREEDGKPVHRCYLEEGHQGGHA